MKKYLCLVIAVTVMLCFVGSACAADKPIKFTETQKKTLENYVRVSQMAQDRVQNFVGYLADEYKVDQSYQLVKDLSGFEKIPQPKVEPKGVEAKDVEPKAIPAKEKIKNPPVAPVSEKK